MAEPMYPLTSAAAQAAERVRAVLATAGFPAARTGHAADFGRSIVAVAGYVVLEGNDHPPRVRWDQRLPASDLEAKLEEIREALNAAGLHAEWVEKAWELEVRDQP